MTLEIKGYRRSDSEKVDIDDSLMFAWDMET